MKKEYIEPVVESEEVFEQTALACGSLFPQGDSKDSPGQDNSAGCDAALS